MKTQKCIKCGKVKTINSFYKTNSNKNGLMHHCKKCDKKISKIYRTIHKVEISIMKKKYHQNHKKEIKSYWQTPNGIYTIIKTNAKRRNLIVDFTKKDFIDWYNNQEKRCVYCKRTKNQAIKDKNQKYSRLTIDRRDNNRGYKLKNIVLACMRCNSIKGDNLTYEQMIKIGHVLSERIK